MAAVILQFPTKNIDRSRGSVPRGARARAIDIRLRKALGILTMITDAVEGIEDPRTVDALYAAQGLLNEAKSLVTSR